MKIKELRNKKIIIATHVFTTGPAQDLRDYLNNNKIEKVMFIGHPLFYDQNLRGSSYTIYQNSKVIKENVTKIKKRPIIFDYFIAAIKNIVFVIKTKTKWDIFIGSNCLNAATGVILKKLGFVNKCVYYVIDYNPKRFSNLLLNKIYNKTDLFSARFCDETWNLSPRMVEGRKKYFDFDGGNQKIVPVGVWLERIKQVPFDSVDKTTLIFMGHILKKQGIQYVLETVPEIISKIPNFKFKIIGGGEYLDTLKKLAKNLDIEDSVIFTGYVEKHKDLEKMMVQGAAAIAPYERYNNTKDKNLSFTYYADPAKIKVYLACGLPILLADLSYNARSIEDNDCGKVINTDPKNIAENVVNLLKDEETLKTYRENAINYASKLDWNIIFKKALENLI